MLEALGLVVDFLTRAIPAAAGRRRKKKLDDVGSELFLIYFRLNEVIVTAERILGVLENYVRRMSQNDGRSHLLEDLTGKSWQTGLLMRQRTNLQEVAELIFRDRSGLMLIDAPSYNALTPLLDRKMGLIRVLIRAMDGNRLPVAPSAEDIHCVVSLYALGGQHLDLDSEEMRRVQDRIFAEALSFDDVMDESTYRAVQRYLDAENPREQLKRIKGSVSNMRRSLLKHFTVEDMLLRAGDERFSN
ncbi:hypothetical protein ACWT_3186 [Actinoplanes sp. SE50]|uniref:hypothetical protein n=1 Tax=unclassified Actinoplanes TaxID=2626549 RepID=UPI00023EC7AB|nr:MULTISPECIES: hypothetical protein [unclassified Actinoplanes]AEV84209.1 hypothetical protein ACPL_3314 [Actinoplanes sp. SE50/110]ATO82601.1 hypothetical protein ACWT_3186 [Actinoplanes sp. SE50]SLM00008.1 uncharacterized protein ACSP50_3240 [Actinoplanes sp. SE50/110]